ncbi:MAG: helix-turn-helix transcriptional regulator [Halobacteriales archaeon]
MRLVAALATLALLFLFTPVAAGVGTADAGTAEWPETTQTASLQANATDQPTTTFRIHLRTSGNADWNVTTRYHLETKSDREAFAELAQAHRNGNAETLSPQPFIRAADQAEVATGRSMSITNIEYTAGRTNETGRLSMQFTWTNFTERSGERLRLGDVFQSGTGSNRGTWFPRLSAQQELIIVFPEGYQAVSSSQGLKIIAPGTIQVTGPTTFEPGNPSVELQPIAPNGEENNNRFPIIAGIGGAAVAGAAVVYLLLQRRRVPDEEPTPADDSEIDAAAESKAQSNRETSEPRDEASPTEAEEPEDFTLLSDEERVERLLEENDGRMRQAAIVEETDWSNAKVSQLLSRMAEAGRIEKLRIGRENLISLPDESDDGQ